MPVLVGPVCFPAKTSVGNVTVQSATRASVYFILWMPPGGAINVHCSQHCCGSGSSYDFLEFRIMILLFNHIMKILKNINQKEESVLFCTVLYCTCYLPFYILHYSPTLLQSWVHRPKIRNTNFNLSALSFLPDPEQIISDLGKCSGSNRIRIHNTEFSVYCSKCKSWLSWFVNHWLTLQTALSVPLLSSSCYFCCSLCLKILSHIFGWCHLPTAVTSRVISALFQYSSLTLKTKGADQASGMGILIALCHWTLIWILFFISLQM